MQVNHYQPEPSSPPSNPFRWLWWALFGNDKDGYYGIYPHTTIGAIKWWFRNPAHNLMFYVLGIANRPSTTYTWTAGNWTFALTKADSWRIPLLPFVAYFRPFFLKAYIGWRPGGVFGIKLHPDSTGQN